MNINWLIFSYRLIVFYGFYVTVQGVKFPLTINELVIESENETVISYDSSSTTRIIITRNKADTNWFDVWTNPTPDTSPSLQLELKTQDFKFSFRFKELDSFVMNIFVGHCYISTSSISLSIQMVIDSRTDARSFRFDEIFLRTNLPNLNELKNYSIGTDGSFVGIFFDYKLNHVLVYMDNKVKRLTRNAILNSILIEDSNKMIRRQFVIHPPNDIDFRFSDILFSAHFVNTATKFTEDRVVLGIWLTDETLIHICLIFAGNEGEIQEFREAMSSFVNPELVIDDDQANSLFDADLENIEDIP